MKSCPQCKQTYTDETLNFCLNDGTILVVQSFNQNQQAETVMMNSPRVTSNQQPPVFVNQQPQYAVSQPRKKSKAWIWILAIVGVIGLGGIVIFIALVGLVASLPDGNENSNVRTTNTPKSSDLFGKDDSKSSNSSSSDDVMKDDLSEWLYDDPKYGRSTYNNDELTMTSKANDYTFMLSTPDNQFETANAISKVSVKNVDNKTTGGFGLIIHSSAKNPGQQDYVFLIDSKTRRFRISKHTNTKERTVINWTSSNSINNGSEYNELEVQDEDGTMTFFINGQSVKAIEDNDGNASGIIGLYVSGGVPIAFKNLEIRK
jgi:hypothetical protein